MREIGIRELGPALSDALHCLRRGGRLVRVTLRDDAIADIVSLDPIAGDARLNALVLKGRLTRATLPMPRKPPPLADVPLSASCIILADRDEER